MARSRLVNRSGVVVRRFVTPAADLILTLLTPQGKLKVIARAGARGPMASRLNLFQHVNTQLYVSPRADLAVVEQVTLEGALPRLAEPERYPFAHLLCELADALFQEGERSAAAFELFTGALRGVSHHPDPAFVALVMSYKLLGLAGFQLRTRTCARCGAPDPASPDPLSGQLVCRRCASLPDLASPLLEFLDEVQRLSVRRLMETPLPEAWRPEAWRLLERFVTVQVADVRSWRSLLAAQVGAVAAD